MVNYVVCVEPSVSAADCRVTAKDQDILVYPHVDSCMTITVFLAGGTVVGGHVSMWDDDTASLDATVAISNFAKKMKPLITTTIEKVMFVGANMRKSQGASHYSLRSALTELGASTNKALPSFLFIDTVNTDTAFDLFVDLGSHTLTIQRWDKADKRGELEPPKRSADPIYEAQYNVLSGKYDLDKDGSTKAGKVRNGV